MKTNLLVITFILLSTFSFGQFRSDSERKVDIKSGITNYEPSSLLLGFINPENFDMKHSVSLSYGSFGSEGMALSVYTNSMSYKFTDNLNVQLDASLVNTPYNTFGDALTNSINGLHITRAQLNYQPADNLRIMLQYRGGPGTYYSPFSCYGVGGFIGRALYESDPFEY
ncbi:MAG: hypothetical protein PVH88_24280 [Ignavibacteria bacterium]